MTDHAPVTLQAAETDPRGSVHRIVRGHCPTHLDLFSGIGGFALAAQWTGWQTIAFSEIEPYACKVLKRHWPDVPNLGDIRNVRGVRADLVTGGFPCQPYSLAGKRRGASDDRALWPEMLRVIDEARPAWVLGENVPGIINLELDRVLDDLERIGYAAWPLGIPACAVDARHRRERVWIVAYSERAERRPGDEGSRCARERRDDERQAAGRFGKCGEVLADASGTRLAQRQEQSAREERETVERSGNTMGDAARKLPHGSGKRQFANPSRWLTEPGMGRVAHGIPDRAHRLRGLGNAIVPQVAAPILAAMLRMTPNAPGEPRRKEDHE